MSLTNILGATLVGASILAAALGTTPVRAADWPKVQEIKREMLRLAAKHAMEQQKTTRAESVAIRFPSEMTKGGRVAIHATSPKTILLGVVASPYAGRKKPTAEFLRLTLPKPIDMISKHSGLAFTVYTHESPSPEVRIGCRLIGSGGKKVAVIDPYIPVLSAWGENPHEIYLDWAFIAYARPEDAIEVLKSVEAIEFTMASMQRAPKRGPSSEAKPADFHIENLRLVDYLKGSYDPSRQWLTFDEEAQKYVPGKGRDLTLQHRTQEVTGVVAMFGGQAGLRSAVDSLDMCIRTQCWDGSFLDGRRGERTVTSGEYTFGFTTYSLLTACMALEETKSPLLDEKLTIGPATRTRREFLQEMLYRAAMSRTAATPSGYTDDIIGGNTLITGANRVLGYAVAMRMVADVLTDKGRCEQVLSKYRPLMREIADAQGKFSGGFPVLGEGNKFGGKGIHYDAGYTRTHMDWLIVGVQRTGDPLLVEMIRRYQTVFEAAMNSQGTGLRGLISERGFGKDHVSLILPDVTAQVGLKYRMPIVAQWGYNVGIPRWKKWETEPGNHFSFASHTRGYGLGAFTGRLIEDLNVEPEPKDLGYLFPRQFPIWSSRLYTKDGKLVRTSKVTIRPDGAMANDFRIEVGEYPVTVGVPVFIKSPEGTVTATADKLSGWPKLLPEGAAIEISGDLKAAGKVGRPIALTLSGPCKVIITGPVVTLPEEAGGETVPLRAELTLTPEKAGLPIELTVLRGTAGYEHTFSVPRWPERQGRQESR